MHEPNAMMLIERFNNAFSARERPSEIIGSQQLDSAELASVQHLKRMHWRDLNSEYLEKNFDFLNWLSPKAFCYFLPGVCVAGIREDRCDLLAESSILGMLDREPSPQHWDGFFVERWPLLRRDECEVLQEWILWLTSHEEFAAYENSASRALETLELLKTGVTAMR